MPAIHIGCLPKRVGFVVTVIYPPISFFFHHAILGGNILSLYCHDKNSDLIWVKGKESLLSKKGTFQLIAQN